MAEPDKELVMNQVSRAIWRILEQGDRRRNIEAECGHPQEEITAQTYQLMFERNPIGARVVEVLPRQSWQVQPEVYEDEDPKTETPFEKAWNALASDLDPMKDYFKGPKGSPIWEILKRADEMSGIGRYGVILLGLDDLRQGGVTSLSQPATSGSRSEPRKLTFLRVFSETHAKVIAWDQDLTSPRYGKPVLYQLTFTNPAESSVDSDQGTSQTVHFSRVVHIADNLQSSEVLGIPRQRPVYYNLLDLKKLYGGSAEMYWKGAFPGYGFEAMPEFVRAKLDLDKMKDIIERFAEGLDRYYAVSGVQGKSLAPQVVDPTPQIMVHLQAICIKLNMPMRIFMGSERGELSSAQDDGSWNDILREREYNYLSPKVVARFVNQLIWLGVLPEPVSYNIHWPDLTSQTPQERANIAFKQAQSLAQYSNSKSREVMGAMAFLTNILGLSDEVALSILEAGDLMPVVVPADPLPIKSDKTDKIPTQG